MKYEVIRMRRSRGNTARDDTQLPIMAVKTSDVRDRKYNSDTTHHKLKNAFYDLLTLNLATSEGCYDLSCFEKGVRTISLSLSIIYRETHKISKDTSRA